MSQSNTAEKRNRNWEVALTKVQDFTLQPGVNSFVNPFSMLKLAETENIVENIDHLYVDGISLVKFINAFTGKSVGRYSFDDSSIAPAVFNFAKASNLRVAIVGTTQPDLEKSVAILEKRYDLKVAYSRNGFFDNEEQREEVMQQLLQLNCDIVVCGMGTPFQERFLIDLKNKGWNGYGYTCGGYLHQLATKEKYYPPLFDKLNIRWIYRIYDEPKLFHRYFVLYPQFAYRFMQFRFKKKRK